MYKYEQGVQAAAVTSVCSYACLKWRGKPHLVTCFALNLAKLSRAPTPLSLRQRVTLKI